jgi:hypothetical protein
VTKSQQKPKKPQKVVRKLTLSKEKIVQLNEPGHPKCTNRATGCPIHTC